MTLNDRSSREHREADEDVDAGGIVSGPVSDWAADFSHMEPEWAADPYPIQDDLRQRCPIAHTNRFGGAWLPTRYEEVAAIAYDTERFSSRSIVVGNFRPPRAPPPAALSPPAVPPHRAQAAPGRLYQDLGREAGGEDEGILPLTDRQPRGAGHR